MSSGVDSGVDMPSFVDGCEEASIEWKSENQKTLM